MRFRSVEKEEGNQETKEEVVISKIELDELKRLHVIADQAPNRVIGTVNLQVESRKNLLDYHTALSKKYKFNPWKVGINRVTGQLQPIPKEKLDEGDKERIKQNKVLHKIIKELNESRVKKEENKNDGR